jgi:hypothetical protein
MAGELEGIESTLTGAAREGDPDAEDYSQRDQGRKIAFSVVTRMDEMTEIRRRLHDSDID